MGGVLRWPAVTTATTATTVLRLVGAVLAALTLVACGATGSAPVPGPTGTTQAPSRAPAGDGEITLPWPVGDAAGLAALQQRVDGGAQPWLLDPAQVAAAFGTAAYRWPDAQAVVAPGGGPADTRVELRGPDGRVARLVLAQPGRSGPHGVWVVRAADRP